MLTAEERAQIQKNLNAAMRNSPLGIMGDVIQSLLASDAEREAEILRLERVIEELVNRIAALKRYVAVEGRPDGDTVLVGLAYDSHIWGPSANSKYEMFELAESVEKWLHEQCDVLMALVESISKGGGNADTVRSGLGVDFDSASAPVVSEADPLCQKDCGAKS